ncbi:unnamed protein product, partial [Ectocarpus fasciculatus]
RPFRQVSGGAIDVQVCVGHSHYSSSCGSFGVNIVSTRTVDRMFSLDGNPESQRLNVTLGPLKSIRKDPGASHRYCVCAFEKWYIRISIHVPCPRQCVDASVFTLPA